MTAPQGMVKGNLAMAALTLRHAEMCIFTVESQCKNQLNQPEATGGCQMAKSMSARLCGASEKSTS